MKSLLVSGISFLILVLITILFFRCYRGKKYLKVFFAAFAITIPVYWALYQSSPANLWFLPNDWLAANSTVGFWNGLFILALLFHCFADVSYTTVLTGFSTNLIVHIAKKHQLTSKEIQEIYGISSDSDPVTEWRINHLLGGQYITATESGYQLLPKGKCIAIAAQLLQRLFNTGEGG